MYLGAAGVPRIPENFSVSLWGLCWTEWYYIATPVLISYWSRMPCPAEAKTVITRRKLGVCLDNIRLINL